MKMEQRFGIPFDDVKISDRVNLNEKTMQETKLDENGIIQASEIKNEQKKTKQTLAKNTKKQTKKQEAPTL